MTPRHAHPVTILGNLWKVLYLIIIPVLRGFFLALQSNLAGWIEGAWLDILIFLLMIGIAVLRWWNVSVWWDKTLLHIRSGVLFSGQSMIPWHKIVTVSISRPFYMRPFGAVRLRVDTMGGGFKNADFSLLLRSNLADKILNHHSGVPQGDDCYTPSTASVLALSILNSNSFAGVVFVATLITQSGKLLGNEFSNRLIGTFEEAARNVDVGIPPAASAIAILILIGWAFSFILYFLRYKNLLVSQNTDMFHIRGGIIDRQRYGVRYGEINFIDIRQSLTTRVLGLHSLYISAVGYGKQRDDMACVIPTEKQKNFAVSFSRLFQDFSPSPRTLLPERGGVMRFLAEPLIFCAGIPAVMALTLWLLENWGSFVLFVGLMGMVPSGFFLAVRVFDYCTGGISRKGGVFTLRYSKGFYLHTVVVHADKIVQAEIRQSFFQRMGGNCDVILHTRAEGRSIHRCRSVNLEKARRMFA